MDCGVVPRNEPFAFWRAASHVHLKIFDWRRTFNWHESKKNKRPCYILIFQPKALSLLLPDPEQIYRETAHTIPLVGIDSGRTSGKFEYIQSRHYGRPNIEYVQISQTISHAFDSTKTLGQMTDFVPASLKTGERSGICEQCESRTEFSTGHRGHRISRGFSFLKCPKTCRDRPYCYAWQSVRSVEKSCLFEVVVEDRTFLSTRQNAFVYTPILLQQQEFSMSLARVLAVSSHFLEVTPPIMRQILYKRRPMLIPSRISHCCPSTQVTRTKRNCHYDQPKHPPVPQNWRSGMVGGDHRRTSTECQSSHTLVF